MEALGRAVRLVAIAAGLLVAAMPAVAQSSLDKAKAAGLVGERPDGLLGVVSSASGQIEAMVRDINDRRLAQYQEIARRTGTSLPAVQAVAGEKAIAQSPPGSFVMEGSGAWRRK